MRIKVELTPDEIKHLGFKRAMNLKWQFEDILDGFANGDSECLELMDEIQEK